MMETRKAAASVEGRSAGRACLLHAPEKGGEAVSLEAAFRGERERLEALSGEAVFSAHLEILDDPLLKEHIDTALQEGRSPAEAVRSAESDIAALFAGIDDEYLRARTDDLHDVCRGLIRRLEGRSGGNPSLPEDAVIVADEILPSDMAMLDLSKVRAIVAAQGSATGHAAIIARAKGIPALFGVGTEGIQDGDILLVDGDSRTLVLSPSQEETDAFRKEMSRETCPAAPLLTAEGRRVRILGNAGSLEDLDAVLEAGAEGIGLFRTEFLFLRSDHLPTEEEQYGIYREAVLRCGGRPLTIRTLDVGGDKHLPCWPLAEEENPFLGLRGIRLTLSRPDILSAQIRAILRAAALGPVQMLIPMVTSAEEVGSVRELAAECTEALRKEGRAHAEKVPTGIMIETPAAVLTAQELAREADFFSIGTNDLTQYIQVADRGNAAVAAYCNPLAPAVRKALEMTVNAGRNAGIPVGVCGEMGADRTAQEYLAGLGIDSLSLSSPRQIRARSAAVCSS